MGKTIDSLKIFGGAALMFASMQESYTSICNLIEGTNYLLTLDVPSVSASLLTSTLVFLVSSDSNENMPSRKYLRY